MERPCPGRTSLAHLTRTQECSLAESQQRRLLDPALDPFDAMVEGELLEPRSEDRPKMRTPGTWTRAIKNEPRWECHAGFAPRREFHAAFVPR